MSKALSGAHYCVAHQGNHSHYAEHNCELCVAHAEVERLTLERDEAKAENTRLRAALANSDQPCAYCLLPAEEWAKCQSGFPGCARGDDAMGCPELGAAMVRDALQQQVYDTLVALLKRAKDEIYRLNLNEHMTADSVTTLLSEIDAVLTGREEAG
jgi:hypothetical protein